MNHHPEEITATVLRFERSSIHDGQGLRTVLFLKGCPLSCAWCSTPESQRIKPEKGYLQERCTGCGTCVKICPQQAITLIDNRPQTDISECRNCFTCVDSCPQEALKGYGRVMTVKETVAEIAKDEIFFFHSGGGLTISGGECLQQADFTAAVLKECRQRGIDTAVETSLFAPWAQIEKVIPHLNHIYVDLKHPTPEMHQDLCGVSNREILENLKRLDDSSNTFSLHIRIPLIPSLNDSDEVLSRSMAVCESLKKLTEVEILPYHRLGIASYGALGRLYHLEHIQTPTRQYLMAKKEVIDDLNLPFKVTFGAGYI